MAAESFGSLKHWTVAPTVIVVALLLLKTSGALSNAAILIGLLAGYAVAASWHGQRGFPKASWVTSIQVLPYGFEFSLGAVIAVTLVQSCLPLKRLAMHQQQQKQAQDATQPTKKSRCNICGRSGNCVRASFGLPNTSFSQNVALSA